jgi:hypothetical protein
VTQDNNTAIAEHAPPKMTPLKTWVAHGLRCAIVRAPLYGAINGYVQAADDIPEGVAEQLSVHGGVTYEHGRWVGFDTLHGGDIWPGELERTEGGIPWSRRWDEDLVIAETERLAAELKRVMEQ